MTSRNFLAIPVLLMGLWLSACGSDNNDTPSSENSAEVLVGTFVDSPVFGLEYITSSGLMGLTNAAGEFDYLAGDTVTFSIGPVILGDIIAQSVITPFDLAGFELPTSILDIDDLLEEIAALDSGNSSAFATGVNMLIFLQSLDQNNNPDDGIEIVSAVGQFFVQTAAALLFNQNTDNFISSFFVLFAQLIANNILDRSADASPVDRDDAIRHFLSSNAFD